MSCGDELWGPVLYLQSLYIREESRRPHVPPRKAQVLAGATAYARGGKKIGDVSAIYIDDATGEPEG